MVTGTGVEYTYGPARFRPCLDSPQMGNLAPFPDQTEISAFGFARLKRTRLALSGTVPYKFHKYIGIYFSTLKTLFSNKIPPFFISFYNNYNKIHRVIIVNVYPIYIYYLNIVFIYYNS